MRHHEAIRRRAPLAIAIGAALAFGIASIDARAQLFAPTISLSTLDGSNGFRLDGVAAGDYSSRTVSAAGDINDDGIDDLIVGATGADPTGMYSGSSYVVFGHAGGIAFPASLSLSSLDGTNGFRLDGAAAFDYSGKAIGAAGDINGDGIDDLIVGADRANPSGNDSGSSYVIYGRGAGTPFSAVLPLSSLDGSSGFRLDGVAANDFSGSAVSSVGDVNGDGIDDLIVGAYGAGPSGTFSGRSYVVFGRANSSPFPAMLSLSTLDGSNGFRLDGAAGEIAGSSVAEAGDVNGDGIDDLIVGAEGVIPANGYPGRAFVVFGRTASSPFPATLSLSSLDGSNGFRLDGVTSGDLTAHAVSAAGDVNGDGHDDLIIGAIGADNGGASSGSTYVVFGRASDSPFAAVLPLSSLDGTNGFRLDGGAASDSSGGAVSAAGDVNGDGVDDLIVGASSVDSAANASGSSYVVFGRTASVSFPAVVPLSSLDGVTGFRLDGVSAGDRSGTSVSSAGDVNGDGIDDLIVGAGNADPAGSSSGSSYVVFGRIGLAAIDFSSVLLDFGEVSVGQNSPAQSLTLFSVGSARLDVDAISAAGAGFVRVGGSCPIPPFRLVFEGQCTLDYRFTPSVPGSAIGLVDVASSGVGSPDSFVLLGTGVESDTLFTDGFDGLP